MSATKTPEAPPHVRGLRVVLEKALTGNGETHRTAR